MKTKDGINTRPNRPELDAIKVPSAIDIAWAAGIFEGEGTVRLCGRGKRSLAVSVPQKDPEFLYVLRDFFGGSVNPPCASNPCYKWDICGDRARLFIAQIYQYLYSRRRSQVQAANALDFLRGFSPIGMVMDGLKLHMASFYEDHRKMTSLHPETRRQIAREKYANDEVYREKCKAETKRRKLANKLVNEKDSKICKVVSIENIA